MDNNQDHYHYSTNNQNQDPHSLHSEPLKTQQQHFHHQANRSQEDDGEPSCTDANQSNNLSIDAIDYHDIRSKMDSNSNDLKLKCNDSLSQGNFIENEYQGLWIKERSEVQDNDRRESFKQYMDEFTLSRRDLQSSSSMDISNASVNHADMKELNDVSDEVSSTTNNSQILNETFDMPNESIDSYRGNMLNETYSQDNESDYRIRRSSSGLSVQCDRDSGPQKPKLRDITDLAERESMFERYIEECCKIYDFRNDLSLDDITLRDGKMVMLSEFFEILVEEPDVLAPFETLYDQFFRMFQENLFRSLPPSSNQNVPEYDPEEDDPPLEPAWPHLQLVYHVLLRFTSTPLFETDRAKNYIDEKFVFKLLQLFESEDPRERSYLKSILHRIYGQFLGLRSYIRRQIGNIFSTFIYENEYHNGIADLLEILGSIINGFVQPLKEEHKVFLLKILMPLHKARTLGAYHAQLSICIVQYVEKDPALAETIINSLLRYWPKVHSTKEVMFLNQIEEILDIIEPAEFQKIMNPLFKQLGRCIQSNQFQVAERVLYFWNNEYILSLINDNAQAILPIVIPALHIDPRSHWNRTIHGLIYNALKLSTQMDQKLFHDLVQQQDLHKNREALSLDDKDRKWRRVQQMAEENATKMNRPTG